MADLCDWCKKPLMVREEQNITVMRREIDEWGDIYPYYENVSVHLCDDCLARLYRVYKRESEGEFTCTMCKKKAPDVKLADIQGTMDRVFHKPHIYLCNSCREKVCKFIRGE